MHLSSTGILFNRNRLTSKVESGKRSLNFFQYHLHFNDVFQHRGGFDIVIGNPPYVRADSGDNHLSLRQAIEASNEYETLWEKWDLYIAFIERGYKLLKPNGITSMIVSDAYCHSKYAQKSQNWFLQNSRIIRLDFLSKLQFFEAAVRNIIYFFQKTDARNNKPGRFVHETELGDIRSLPTDEQPKLNYRVFFPEDVEQQKICNSTLPLKSICYISVGMVVHANEKIAQGAFRMEDLVSESKDKLHPKPFVEGKHLDLWLPSMNKWLEWGTNRAPKMFRRPTFPELYEVKEKILVQRSPGPDPKACYDNQKLHFTESSVGFIPWHSLQGVRNNSIKKSACYFDGKLNCSDLPNREELEKTSRQFSIKFLLAVINSTFSRNFIKANRRSNIHVYPDDWKQLPIPDVPIEQQQPIINLVDQILINKQSNSSADISSLEAEINDRVAHLYGLTSEEITQIEAGQ